jgi:hypothetical protein
VNLPRVAPGFLEHVRQGERAKLVNDFTIVADAVVAAMYVEEILRGGG